MQAKANRGILYVDEVNLLDDHLVDVLLDSAASGWNTVEREGISISHPARFILVGSGGATSHSSTGGLLQEHREGSTGHQLHRQRTAVANIKGLHGCISSSRNLAAAAPAGSIRSAAGGNGAAGYRDLSSM